MASSDPTTILIQHNRWATAQLLNACESLSSEQFNQAFPIGPGSLYQNLRHILGAMRGWGDLLGGREQRPRLEEEDLSIEDMRRMLDSLTDDLAQSVARHPVDEIVTGERGGRTYSFSRGAVITHLMTHGMHHRAQCLNMLRQLGVSPLPPSSIMEWTMIGDNG